MRLSSPRPPPPPPPSPSLKALSERRGGGRLLQPAAAHDTYTTSPAHARGSSQAAAAARTTVRPAAAVRVAAAAVATSAAALVLAEAARAQQRQAGPTAAAPARGQQHGAPLPLLQGRRCNVAQEAPARAWGQACNACFSPACLPGPMRLGRQGAQHPPGKAHAATRPAPRTAPRSPHSPCLACLRSAAALEVAMPCAPAGRHAPPGSCSRSSGLPCSGWRRAWNLIPRLHAQPAAAAPAQRQAATRRLLSLLSHRRGDEQMMRCWAEPGLAAAGGVHTCAWRAGVEKALGGGDSTAGRAWPSTGPGCAHEGVDRSAAQPERTQRARAGSLGRAVCGECMCCCRGWGWDELTQPSTNQGPRARTACCCAVRYVCLLV